MNLLFYSCEILTLFSQRRSSRKTFFLEKLRLYAHKMLLYFLKFLKTVNKTLLVVVGLTCLCEIVKIA